MPTVLRQHGFRVMIYQGDSEHGPPYVHVIKDGGEVVINLAPLAVREIRGMSRTNVRAAVRLLESHLDELVDAWTHSNG